MTGAGEIRAALGPVVETLERLRVPYMLTGSVASSMHGVPRTTLDADLVARIEGTHARPLVEALGHAYYAEETAIHDAVRNGSSFNLIHQPSMVKIDIFVAKNRPYDAHALGRRQPARIDGLVVHVATPDDVLLAKLEWFDAGGRVSERQWGDILGILRVQRDAIDGEYLRRWAREIGVGALLERALREA